MRTNQRYSRRSRQSRSHPMIAGLAIGLAIVIGGSVGRQLDTRYRTALHAAAEAEAMRASLRVSSPSGEDSELSARREVERASGIVGDPLFSKEGWSPSAPVLYRGVDISNLLLEDFTLKRSEGAGYSLERVIFDGDISRPGTFFECGIGDGKNGASVVRWSKDLVALMYRAPGGEYVELARAGSDKIGTCTQFEVAITAQDTVVRCGGIDVLSSQGLGTGQGRVYAASNLVRSEVRSFVLGGRVGDTPVEDTL